MNVDRFWYSNMTGDISPSWHYLAGTLSLFCLVGGMISNGLVILVFLRHDALQRPRNYFLINLAVTDLGLLLTNNTMHIVSSFRKQWIFGQLGCNFYSACGGVFGLTSIATMASISVTRLAAVNNPFSSLTLTGRFTLGCLVGAWFYGSIWIMPPLFGWNRFILEGFGTSCTFDYVSKDRWDRMFILVLVIGGFFIPLLVLIISYTIILVKLSQRGRQMIRQSAGASSSHSQSTQLGTHFFSQLHPAHDAHPHPASTPTHDPSEGNNMSRNMRRSEIRATRTALMVCAVFCAAWGPYTFMALLSLFGWDHLINAYTTAMLGIFTKAAAGINPLVYALSLRGFREQICFYVKGTLHCDDKHQRLLSMNPELHRSLHPNSVDINARHRTYSTTVYRSQL